MALGIACHWAVHEGVNYTKRVIGKVYCARACAFATVCACCVKVAVTPPRTLMVSLRCDVCNMMLQVIFCALSTAVSAESFHRSGTWLLVKFKLFTL